MKLFPVIVILATVAYVSAAEPPSGNEFVGELRDVENGAIIKIGAIYNDGHDEPGLPARVDRPSPTGPPTCESRPGEADDICRQICISREHTGGSCKENICTCVHETH